MLRYLSRTRTIWITFFLTLVLTLAFGVVMKIWNFGIIDEMFHPEQIKAHIKAMTPLQRYVHAWMTATLDVVYPLTYGAFFIGITCKAFERFGLWLALPAIFVIPSDLAEGVSQVLLLNGHDSAMILKVIFTPIKLILFITSLGIAIAALVNLLRKNQIRKP